MRILSLTPYQNNTKAFNTNNSNLNFMARPKKLQINTDKFVRELINDKNSNLGQEIKELMSKPLSRAVFTTTLVSMAAAVTKLILGSDGTTNEEVGVNGETGVNEKAGINGEVKNGKIGARKAKLAHNKKNNEKRTIKKDVEKKEITEPSSDNVQAKRKYNRLKITEDVLAAKLEDMAARGLTLKQMGEELGGLQESSVCRYLKKYNIQKANRGEKHAETVPNVEKSSVKEELFQSYLSDKSELLNKLKSYEELENGYKALVLDHIKNPKDEQLKQSLDGIEKLFQKIVTLPSRFRKPILQIFNQQYSNELKNVGYIVGNIQPGTTIQEYMTDFEKGLSKEDITNWAKTPAFTYQEFKMAEEMPSDTIEAIHELKKQGKFKFEIQKDDEWKNYKFYLDFEKNTELTEKLKMISNFHEAIYGNIYIHKDRGTILDREVNIKEELQTLINKDKNLDSIYNILKFLEPSKIEDSNINKDELYDYNNINQDAKAKMENIINSLDSKNPRVKELESVIDDDYVFENLMTNCHAKIRFVSRFVLNEDVQSGELYDKCCDAVECLAKDLEEKFKDKYIIFPYKLSDSSAPCFYLPKSKLGDFIRVTLNNHGQIHTIFEDSKLKNRR